MNGTEEINNYTCLKMDTVEGSVDANDYSIVHVSFRAGVNDPTQLKEVGTISPGHWDCNGDAVVRYEIEPEDILATGEGDTFCATVKITPPFSLNRVHHTIVKIDIKGPQPDDEEAMPTVGPKPKPYKNIAIFENFQYLVKESLFVRIDPNNKKHINIKFCVFLPANKILEEIGSDGNGNWGTVQNGIKGNAIAVYKTIEATDVAADLHLKEANFYLDVPFDDYHEHQSGVRVEADEEAMPTADGHGLFGDDK